jgi:hypothetical protein
VAVKVFQLDLPPERMHVLVAELEALVAAGLEHPAIAAPLATGTDGIVVYLVQQYVPADSLDIVMRDHGLASPGDPLRVAAQLAAGLDFAAGVKVHHGALHPRDVLLSPGDARLTGHGVAGAIEKAGVTAPVRRPYAAPERIAGGALDLRADVFSLAALIHEMLWGRRLTAIGEEAAGALTQLPGGDLAVLRATFARALAPKPDDRFETAHEFVAALQEAFPGVSLIDDQSPVQSPVQSRVVGRQSTAEPRLPLDDPPLRSGLEGRPLRGTVVEVAGAVDGAATERVADLKLRTTSDPGPDALGELELRAAETVDPEPVTGSAAARTPPPRETPLLRPGSAGLRPAAGVTGLFGRHERDLSEGPPEGPADRMASPSWAVAAALMVGIALGFGGGYRFAGRHVAPAPAPAATAPPAAPPPGREWTEGAVNDNPSRGGTAPGEPDATANASTAGRLLVRSTPAGARVLVDGREQGRTPATVLDLTKGTHRLRVTHAGYAAEDRRIVVTAAGSTQLVTVELKRPAAIAPAAARTPAAPGPTTPGTSTGAALSVDSRPGGARVFIDGRLVGTTPTSVPQVGAGAHAIRLERDGYRRWSSSIRIVAGQPNRVTASLEK